MTDYKKQYIKYKLKYLLLKQKNLQFKQKAGSLPTSHGIEKMFSEIIDYIKNLLPYPINQNDDQDWDVTPPSSPTSSLDTGTPPHYPDFGQEYFNAVPPSLDLEE